MVDIRVLRGRGYEDSWGSWENEKFSTIFFFFFFFFWGGGTKNVQKNWDGTKIFEIRLIKILANTSTGVYIVCPRGERNKIKENVS